MILLAAAYACSCLSLAAGTLAYWRLCALWRKHKERLFLGGAVFSLLLGGVGALLMLLNPAAWLLLLPAGLAFLLPRPKGVSRGFFSGRSLCVLLCACLAVLVAAPVIGVALAAGQRLDEHHQLGTVLANAAQSLNARASQLATQCGQISADSLTKSALAAKDYPQINALLQTDLTGYGLSSALLLASDGSVLVRPDKPGSQGQLTGWEWVSSLQEPTSGTGILDGQPVLLAACPTPAGTLVLTRSLSDELTALSQTGGVRLAVAASSGVLAEAGGSPQAATLMDAAGTDKLLRTPLQNTIWLDNGDAVFALQDSSWPSMLGAGPALRLAALTPLPTGRWGAPL
jgi:hypothetical protein